MSKRNWKYDDIVTEQDMNRIESEIEGNQKTLATHLTDDTQQKHIITSDTPPTDQGIGSIWFQTGLGESNDTGGSEGGLVLQNAIVAEKPPEDTTKIWLGI